MASDSILTSSSSEQKWVDQITKVFQKELSSKISDDVCVFQVPRNITIFKPDAYTPQLIALGPYHHFKPELYHMESHKLESAKQVLNQNQASNFQQLVIDELKRFGPTIRACYHDYFDLTDETLAWIVAIDGIFLIHFLKNYGNGQVGDEGDDCGDKKMREKAMVRDIMKLENQIPMVLLKKIWRILQFSSSYKENDGLHLRSEVENDDDFELVSMMIRFCEAQSPLILSQEIPFCLNGKSAHLLDLMYQLIIHKRIEPTHKAFRAEVRLFETVVEVLDKAKELHVPYASEIQLPFKFIQSLPWDKIYGLLGKKKEEKPNKPGIDNQGDETPPVEEIDIPSVSQLCNIAKIEFHPTSGGIRDINFYENRLAFSLPTITLNPNSEVVLRNLVAYEALSAKGSKPRPTSSVEFSQYVDLMSGIIDTSEDSKLLKEAGIIKGNMGDEEIASLFNRINKSSGDQVEDQKSKLEKTSDQVNEYFEKKPRVRVYKALKKYGYAFFKYLTGFCTILLLLLLILQTFCQFYSCTRLFGMRSLRDLGSKLYQPM